MRIVFTQHKRIIAFTLAEVLITLAIIGVVAALTIPTVVQSYRKTQTVTQLKKVYSALANTANLAIADEGPINTWEIGENLTRQAAADFVSKYLAPYLKVSKNCGLDMTGDCECKYSYLNNEGGLLTLDSNWTRFYLNDGTFLGVSVSNTETRKFASVRVDINGKKKPNVYGKDIFIFRYDTYNTSNQKLVGKFVPADLYAMTREQALGNESFGCNKNATGSYCSSVIMYDSWQMKDDYPW